MTAVAQSLTSYQTWYKLSATTPTQPTEDSHTGWSTTEPAWSSSSTDNLYFSVRTVTGDGTITWSAVGMVQSYADLVILKNAIISTVASDYVAQGNSNITSLSSTMLQNVHGVNVYNGTLAVGDSYAHIDGNAFTIKEITSAGTIDDTNDTVVASFGAAKTVVGTENVGDYRIEITNQKIALLLKDLYWDEGWIMTSDKILWRGAPGVPSGAVITNRSIAISSSLTHTLLTDDGYAIFSGDISVTEIDGGDIKCETILIDDSHSYIDGYIHKITPYGIFDRSDKSILDEWTKEETATTSGTDTVVTFTGLDDSLAYDIYCDAINTSAEVKSKTGSGTNVTLVYKLTGSNVLVGTTKCKLRIIK